MIKIWQILPQVYSDHWLLVTFPCACFAISGGNAVCPCTHTSAVRGYFLTDHLCGLLVCLAYVSSSSHIRWKFDVLSHAYGMGLERLATSPKPWLLSSSGHARHLLGAGKFILLFSRMQMAVEFVAYVQQAHVLWKTQGFIINTQLLILCSQSIF